MEVQTKKMNRQISCCQNSPSPSCSRSLSQWLIEPPYYCRHNSHALFGAIREDDYDLARYIIKQIGSEMMMTLLTTHETKFGDTCLTYASSLGTFNIVTLLLDECKSIVQKYSEEIALSDLVNRESCRGKVAIIEAAKNVHIQVASALLLNSADINLVPKTHCKTALDWAVTLKDEAMLALMNEHTQLSQRITSLFKAISNGDKDTVVSLVEGGVPYECTFASPLKDLETIRSQLDEDKKQNCDLQELLLTGVIVL